MGSLYVLSALITYLIFVFMSNYVVTVTDISLREATLVTTIAIGTVTLGMPFTGLLSDYIGRKPCLFVAALGFVLLSYPLYWFMVEWPSYGNFVLVESCFVLLAILYQGVLATTVQEIPQLAVRYTVAAIGYNLSFSIFGSTAPLMVTYLVSATGNKAAPGGYLMFGGLVALMAILSLKETVRMPLLLAPAEVQHGRT